MLCYFWSASQSPAKAPLLSLQLVVVFRRVRVTIAKRCDKIRNGRQLQAHLLIPAKSKPERFVCVRTQAISSLISHYSWLHILPSYVRANTHEFCPNNQTGNDRFISKLNKFLLILFHIQLRFRCFIFITVLCSFVRFLCLCYFHFGFEQNSRTAAAAAAATTTHVALHAAHTEDTDKKTGTKTVLCQSLNTRTTSEFKTNTLTSAHCSVLEHEHSESTHTRRPPHIHSHLPATQRNTPREEWKLLPKRTDLIYFSCFSAVDAVVVGVAVLYAPMVSWKSTQLLAQIQFIFHVIFISRAHAIALWRFSFFLYI